MTTNTVHKIIQDKCLTIKAAERQKAAPLALEAAYSSYSGSKNCRSKNCRSASAIAKSRGSRKSKGVPEIVQPPLQECPQLLN